MLHVPETLEAPKMIPSGKTNQLPGRDTGDHVYGGVPPEALSGKE
jgi:hypothetical protein